MLGGIPDFVIIAGLGFFQAVTVAIIAGLFNREAKKRRAYNEKIDRRAEVRAEESRLSMSLMSANSTLGIAMCLAIKEGSTNGKMDYALEAAQKAQEEYFAHVNDVAAKQLAKN